jgi:hypothetical protein
LASVEVTERSLDAKLIASELGDLSPSGLEEFHGRRDLFHRLQSRQCQIFVVILQLSGWLAGSCPLPKLALISCANVTIP